VAKRETGVDVEETRVRLGKGGVLARATPHGHTREARGEFDVSIVGIYIQTTRRPRNNARMVQSKNGARHRKVSKCFLKELEQDTRVFGTRPKTGYFHCVRKDLVGKKCVSLLRVAAIRRMKVNNSWSVSEMNCVDNDFRASLPDVTA
jgi:hypothetical protein